MEVTLIILSQECEVKQSFEQPGTMSEVDFVTCDLFNCEVMAAGIVTCNEKVGLDTI